MTCIRGVVGGMMHCCLILLIFEDSRAGKRCSRFRRCKRSTTLKSRWSFCPF